MYMYVYDVAIRISLLEHRMTCDTTGHRVYLKKNLNKKEQEKMWDD